MALYSKSLINDGFEIDMMKRIVGREQVSRWDRLTGRYFLLANMMGDSTYFSATQNRAAEHRTIWQAFLGGNLSPMRFYIQNREIKAKWSVQR